jgi:hypothetical protein
MLFDHLVGNGEHCRRHAAADGHCGFQVEDQFEYCLLEDRQTGGPLTFWWPTT